MEAVRKTVSCLARRWVKRISGIVFDPYRVAGAVRASLRIISAAFSPIMIAVALVFVLTICGMMEASTTRNASMPRTRKRGSTTASGSEPIRHVPTG